MIKSAFLRNSYVLILLLLFSINVKAQVSWTGITSSDWSTGSNWSSGVVPGASDNVQIGVVHFNHQPTLSASTSVHNLTFGGDVAVTLTIQANDTLHVVNKIVQNHSGNDLSPSTLITGAGAITCASVMVGDLTPPRFVQTKISTLASKINTFLISGNIDLNSVTANIFTGGVANNNSFFSLQGGTLTLGGKINTVNRLPDTCNIFGKNNPNAKFSIDINSNQDAVLKLNDSSAVHLSNPDYATVDFYNHISDTGRARVEYTGANQLVYTNTIRGVDTSPSNYQDLTISGSGTKTVGSDSTGNQLNINGTLLITGGTLDLKKYAPQTVIAKNFRNTGTVNFGTGTTTINGVSFFNSGGFNAGSGVIQFAGAGQSLVDSTATGTNFIRVGFYHTGTKAIQSGKFTVVPRGKIRLADTATLSVVTGASLTIRSDTTGDASIAALPAGSTVTGLVNVERFITGGILPDGKSSRAYRFLSSPVNFNGTLTGDRRFNLDFLKGTNDYNGIFLTGTGGTTNGFQYQTNPTFYLVREDVVYNGGCYSCGTFRGINKINYTDTNLIGVQSQADKVEPPVADSTLYLPIGNGIMTFFRGNRILDNNTSTGTKLDPNPPHDVPENVTVNSNGVVNQGDVKVKEWYMNGYTFSFHNTFNNNPDRGLILLGNPYPAPINVDNISAADSTSSIYAPNMAATIWVLRPCEGCGYASYITDPTHDKTQVYTGTNNLTNIIGTSQGFMLYINASASNPNAASFTFHEGAKFDNDASLWPAVPSSMALSLVQNRTSHSLSRPLNNSVVQNTVVTSLKNSVATGNKASNKNTLRVVNSPKKAQTEVLPDQFFRLKLGNDSAYDDDIIIRFYSKAMDRYNPQEDAFDLPAPATPHVSLSSYSADHVPLAINKMPFPVHSKKISLFTDARVSGSYSLKASDLENIPSNYNVRLKDKMNGKILNLRVTDHYDFNIDKNVAASFGDRFEVTITNER